MSWSSRTAAGSSTARSKDHTSSMRTARMRRAFGRMRRSGSRPETGRGLATLARRDRRQLLERHAGVPLHPALEPGGEALSVEPLEERGDGRALLLALGPVAGDEPLDAGPRLRREAAKATLEARDGHVQIPGGPEGVRHLLHHAKRPLELLAGAGDGDGL